MPTPSSVVAVIPAYNEARSLGPVVEALRPHVDRVVVVDDGSRDETGRVAAAAGATVLRHDLNRGQGAALQTGIRYAAVTGAGVVVTFDADGQHDPRDVAVLVAPVLEGRADVVLGSRFLGSARDMPLSRRLLLRAAVLFTRMTSRMSVSDAHNGLRALSRDAAERIRIRQDGMAHASEFLSEVRRHGLRWTEAPVNIRYTEYSLSKGQSALGAFRILVDLLVGRGIR